MRAWNPKIPAMTVLCLATAVAGARAETSTDPFLSQDRIILPERSRAIESIDVVEGCGAAPAGRPVTIDGRANDWTAEPSWIAGTARYDGGEWIWTDYPFDDDGTGTFQYPGEGVALEPEAGSVGRAMERQQRYGSNAADVVELRAAADEDFLFLLVRFNFLNAVDSTVLGLGFDVDGDPTGGLSEWPLGARLTSEGVDVFLTAHGSCATVTTVDGSTGLDALGGAIRVGTDDNVFEIALPRNVLGAADDLRLVGGAGLWDPAAGTWMNVRAAPRTGQNADDRPRGALTQSDPLVWNLLFRGDETTGEACPGTGTIAPECQNGTPGTFQTVRQNEVLLGRTTGPYAAELDLGKLGTSDPVLFRRGDEVDFTRVYRSRIEAEGVFVNGNFSVFLSPYQPYSVHVPACLEEGCGDLWPGDQPPLAVLLHGGGGSHVSFASRKSIAEGGTYLYGLESANETLAATIAPIQLRLLGRGQRSPWWRGPGEADVLEAFDDVRRRYETDPERQILTGGSLGGYGTYRLGSLYPDLWTGVSPQCPATHENSFGGRYVGNVDPSTQPFVVDPLIPSLANIPVVHVAGTVDPLTPIHTNWRLRDAELRADLDLRYTEYLGGSHCFDATTGNVWVDNHNTEIADLLRRPREPDPAHVHYRIDPRHFPADPEPLGVLDLRDVGVRYEGAYWVSGLGLRPDVLELGASGEAPGGLDESTLGVIDVVSHARPGWLADAQSCGDSYGTGLGVLGGNPDLEPERPTPHRWQCQEQAANGGTEPVLELAARNLATATLDLEGAGMDATSPFEIRATGDGSFELRLGGVEAFGTTGACVQSVTVSANMTRLDLELGTEACSVIVEPSVP